MFFFMNDLTRRCIAVHVERILAEFSFEHRAREHPEECPCYVLGKPCHDDIPISDFNCFLCYCPEYDNSISEGGCKLGNPEAKGKPFEHPSHPTGRIWDCSDCIYHHRSENVRKYLKRLFGLKD
jgi:Zn-finger protein